MLHSCMSFFDSCSDSIIFLFFLFLLFFVTHLLVLPVLICVLQATFNNYIDDVAAVALAGF